MIAYIFSIMLVFGAPEKTENPKKIMGEALKSFVALVPYMSSEPKFTDPKNEEQIINNLQNLKRVFAKANHSAPLEKAGFRPSVEVIQNHLDDTLDAMKNGNKYFAKNRLQALGGICMSCHTQLKSLSRTTFSQQLNQIDRSDFNDPFDFAEYLFLLRQFSQARIEYEKFLQKQEVFKGVLKDQGVAVGAKREEIAIKRILTIDLKIGKKPKKAIKTLEDYSQSPMFSKMMKDDFGKWITELKLIPESPGPTSTPAEIKTFIETYLEKSEDNRFNKMRLLWAAGVLSEHLRLYPSSAETPHTLLWLARADNELNFSFFYSLSEVYLKECIERYPKSDYAKECFKEYENQIRFGYTGSAGENIPEDELSELVRLKEIITTGQLKSRSKDKKL